MQIIKYIVYAGKGVHKAVFWLGEGKIAKETTQGNKDTTQTENAAKKTKKRVSTGCS